MPSERQAGIKAVRLSVSIMMTMLLAVAPVLSAPKSPGSKKLDKIRLKQLTWKIPQIGNEVQRIMLDNGMVVFLLEDHGLPLIEVNALIRTGQIYEPPSKMGLVSLTGTMLRGGGTVTMSPDSLNRLLEHMAITIETSIGMESGSAYMSALAKDMETGLEIFSQILRWPAFDSAKLEIEKSQFRESIRRRNDSPREILNREFAHLIYGDHVYGAYAQWQDIKDISRADLIELHRKYFHPNRIMLAVAGDFRTPEMLNLLEKSFAGWPASTLELPSVPEVEYESKPGVFLIEKDLSQAYIRIGKLGIKRDNPDRYAIALMNYILGGGSFTSRLTTRVRSDEGLAYSVGSSFDISSRDYGLFAAHCQTKNGTTHRAISLMLKEIADMALGLVSDEELEMAREAFINQFVFTFAGSGQIVNQLMSLEYNDYPPDYYEKYLENIRSVELPDIKRVAEKYINRDSLTIMVLGKSSDFDKGLDDFGKLTNLPLPDPGVDR